MYRTGIDTIDIIVEDESIKELKELMELDKDSILKAINKVKTGNIKGEEKPILVVQPSNFIDRTELCSYTEFKDTLEVLLTDVNLCQYSGVNRIDIAFDFKRNLEHMEKMATYINFAIAKIKKYKDTDYLKLIDMKTAKTKNIKIEVGHYFEHVFYDRTDKKALKGHKSSTRMEVRYKYIKETGNLDLICDKYLKNTIKMYRDLHKQLPSVENEIVKILITLYNQEKNKFYSLTEFLYKYDYYFLTKKVFERFYKEIGMTGNATEYIRGFRKRRPEGLKFISQTSIKTFTKNATDLLKEYMNN